MSVIAWIIFPEYSLWNEKLKNVKMNSNQFFLSFFGKYNKYQETRESKITIRVFQI